MSRVAIAALSLFILPLHVVDAQPSSGLPRDLRRWTLSDAPVVTIGTEGDTNTEFLRIAGGTRMPSGRSSLVTVVLPSSAFSPRPDGFSGV